MTGKWHLDKEPTDFGFQRFFGHLSGATNYYTGDKTFRLNGQPWKVPADGFYTTTDDVDYGLKFMAEARKEKKPFFLYVAFNAPHAPLQPLKEDYEKYKERYKGGWDEMNRFRFAKQKEVGILPNNLKPSPRPDHIPAWASLTPELKDWESRRMAALAGMIDRIDKETGRLIADLVDLLPTIAEVAGAKIPSTFPGRKPTPLAGISLAPVFAEKPMESRPPSTCSTYRIAVCATGIGKSFP